MVKRVGVLTSGGDAPGMNAAIRAVIRAGIINGLRMYAIFEGYKGLIDDDIIEVDRTFVSEILMRGGTILRSARLKEFKEEAYQLKAIEILKSHKIDALVVIGGDGTYRGGLDLAKHGINVIGIPATIDNDIASSDFTIGFDTCLNTIVQSVDKLRDTTSSHQRCSIIEVMGNTNGDLALYGGTACGVDLILSPEYNPPMEEVINKLRHIRMNRARHALVLVSEKLIPDLEGFASEIRQKTGFDTRVEVLGRLQRGGSPSASDRVLAARLGVKAIDLLLEGKSGHAVGIVNNQITSFPFEQALTMKKKSGIELINVISTLK
ncbi:MAG: 6-phosphofructokinase [Erysipelotrichaceae bacterium]|nr:6-phosphofructokinase [Erysipelotrichaceae bacterium]